MRLVLNIEECTGCKLCELACSAKNEGVFNPKKARLKIIDYYTDKGREITGKFCTLCKKCLEACPTEAITFNDEWLTVDDELCTGCGECVDVCPQGVIFLNDEDKSTICNFCEGNPYCVEWCPRECLKLEVAE
ncbi:4Fe-4S dicluster domain-containing protein [Candidatus Aerophobetes bacterium]|nr:4Fe-4S dicluster domain-containing protein [Candidatus Aerophobetes bacterium]